MASDFGFIEYLCDQLQGAGTITYRKMFGEYALYCEGKVVGNSLFVKPAQATEALYGDGPRGAPFAGAKAWYAVQERVDDRQWLCALVRATEAAMPLPGPKKARKPSLSKPKL
jgi:TfoX/Sxy family transcriptional regulator of competence genes